MLEAEGLMLCCETEGVERSTTVILEILQMKMLMLKPGGWELLYLYLILNSTALRRSLGICYSTGRLLGGPVLAKLLYTQREGSILWPET